MTANEWAVAWLTEKKFALKELQEELRIGGDARLPRGFALGQVMEAVACLDKACGYLRNAIRERNAR